MLLKFFTKSRLFFSEKRCYLKHSFSQSGEDLIIKHIFDSKGVFKPSYIDVGAHHPFFLSNTALFYQNGSTGINIEPNPVLFKKFTQHRKTDINLNIGIGLKNEELDYFVLTAETLNTFSKNDAERFCVEGNYKILNVLKVKCNPLMHVINNYCQGTFPAFLNLDVEGFEEVILEQIDFSKNYPLVICVETISFSEKGLGLKNFKLINFLLDKNYFVYSDTYINTIFVRKEFWDGRTS
jgi:FkbM family methyltransferase